jgi:hypothetical protein
LFARVDDKLGFVHGFHRQDDFNNHTRDIEEGHRIPDFVSGLPFQTLVYMFIFAGDQILTVRAILADLAFIILEYGLPPLFYLCEF